MTFKSVATALACGWLALTSAGITYLVKSRAPAAVSAAPQPELLTWANLLKGVPLDVAPMLCRPAPAKLEAVPTPKPKPK